MSIEFLWLGFLVGIVLGFLLGGGND